MTGPSAELRRQTGFRSAARIDPGRWDTFDATTPWKGLATVAGGWLPLAFGRFGLPGLGSPRPVARFVLVGVYVWLLMAGLVWLTGRLARSAGSDRPPPGLTKILQFTGLAHQPMVVLGIVLLVGQVLPIQWPFTVAAAVTLAAWLPALLVAGLASAFERFDRWSLGAAAVAYLAWAWLAGRYLLDRVGHLF